MKQNNRRMCYQGQVCAFEGSRRTAAWVFPLKTGEILLGEAGVRVDVCLHDGQWKLELVCVEDKGLSCSLGFRLQFEDWDEKHYLLAPGAVYDGNRFPVMHIQYPPIVPHDTADPQPPLITTADIPGLAEGKALQLRAGDMSMPLAAVYDRTGLVSWIVRTSAFFSGNESGFAIREHREKRRLIMEIGVPFVKEDTVYNFMTFTSAEPSGDTGFRLREKDTLTAAAKVEQFDCADMPALFEQVFSQSDALRQTEPQTKSAHCFSRAMEEIQKDLDTTRWHEKYGYYSNAIRFGKKTCVLGWPGNCSLSALLRGIPELAERAARSVRYIVEHMQAPSGFFYGMSAEGVAYGDHFEAREDERWLLIRRNADEMLFLERLTDSLGGEEDRAAVEAALRRCADAWVRFAGRYAQMGQFIDLVDEKPILRGSSCAASGIGALAILGCRWNEPRYLDCALALGEEYYQCYAGQGMSFGGPGEAMDASDSESSWGQVIAYTRLFEATKEQRWLDRALHAAKLFSTWCISYQYPFAKDSTFGRMGMQSSGAVFANAQNKHGAPGICSHSGIELVNLFRYSGDERLLRLIRDIVAAIPQYVSMPERPILCYNGETEVFGQICERVNTSDWEGKALRGEVFGGCAWTSNAAMASFTELPGVYVCPDRNVCCVFDCVSAEIDRHDENGVWLTISNLSKTSAEVTLWAERAAQIVPDVLAVPCKRYASVYFNPKESKQLYIPYH